MSAIKKYLNTFYRRWKYTLKRNKIRNQVFLTVLLYIFLFKYCRVIMTELETRKGTQIIDPVLQLLPPHDLSLIIFSLTYIALTTFIIANIIHPRTFIIALQAYCVLIIMRTISIYLVPLEPPIGLILLRDPVTILFMSTPTGGYIVKDLFFSGHISTIMLFYFVSENKNIKRLLLFLAIIVASFILIQHVHYTIDIVAAPFFAYMAYKISVVFYNYLHKSDDIAIAK